MKKVILSLILCLCLVLGFCSIGVMAQEIQQPDRQITAGAQWEYEETSGEAELEDWLVVILVPIVIALIVCLVLKAQMKSVRPQNLAHEYMAMEESHLRIREDRFTHSTRVVRKIPKSDNRK